jgi:flagellar basal body-associated protein FliL
MSDFEFRERLRRDYTHGVIKSAKPQSKLPVSNSASMPKAQKARGQKKIIFIILCTALLITLAVCVSIFLRSTPKPKAANTSPVPSAISQAVSFPVYYPNPEKLPSGYYLDKDSFKNPVKNGVAYSVSYGGNKKIVFSAQQKPSDNELQAFNSSYIPLRTDYQTKAGQAEIGAYNNHGTIETLVSLSTNSSTWLVVTAPYDINQDQLKKVLSAIQR